MTKLYFQKRTWLTNLLSCASFFDANFDGGDGDYDDDDDDIFHATQTNTQFVDSVLINKNC